MPIVPNNMVTIVRDLVNDLDPTNEKYTDARLKQTIAVAAYLVNNEVTFNTTYTVDVGATGITPDPTVAPDNDFIALSTLKAGCMIDTGEAREQAKCVAKVADGTSSVDTSARAKAYDSLLNHEQSNCSLYVKTKEEITIGNLSVGEGILGPYALGIQGKGAFN